MRARWIVVVAGAYGLALALIGLWPTPVDRNLAIVQLPPVAWVLRHLGLEPWEGYNLIEFSANIVLFVPLGILVLLWRTDWGWGRATLLAFAATVTIEVLQNVLRPERFASINDVVANTLGGALGALLVVAARRWVPSLRR
jgi:VanZ family protein